MMNESTQVQTCDCAARGCPMIGTNTRSTSGTTEWFCFIHFGARADQWYAISAELNRLQWLVGIVRGLRGLEHAKNWDELQLAARRAISLSQRGDMQMKESESTAAWMIRLETVLAQSCKDSQAQQEIPV